MKKSTDNNSARGNEDKLPTFPDSLYPQLPQFLQDSVFYAKTNQERDMLLLGTLTSISSCLPNVYGIYDGQKVYSNLYLFVTAPPSSGKGKLKLCKIIIDPIHNSFKELTKKNNDEYYKDLEAYKNDKSLPKPLKPKRKMLFIPANNSSTGVYELLNDNDGKGIIFETEGDTVTQSFNSDYGDYNDGFRKAFQHETITYYRRKDKELVEIKTPCLSVVLSGTPNQVYSLIPNAENGLFSRFCFYYLDIESEWYDVFEHSESNRLNLHYNELGARFFKFHSILNINDDIMISLSESQRETFKDFFSKKQSLYLDINPDNYIANIRRFGLIAFRFMMIFTALRIREDEEIPSERICSDTDFNNALKMVSILIKHSRKVFSGLNKENKYSGFKSYKEQFFDGLPKEFNRQGYLDIAKSLGINDKTADRYISKLVDSNLILKPRHNAFINTLIQDDEKTEDIKEVEEVSRSKATPTESAESSTSAESP
ncbi:DUF3987 domain-containing protein [uncultured Lutibacter sp.]|uniref:DUF3987 domain-containing protein n=1 Tax=uncultured Lutibacter sp. TaxID=437739 RepID=UPI0026238638|nr:DUF3987 domain-containing protein [uncultured Lutibacter sp.]